MSILIPGMVVGNQSDFQDAEQRAVESFSQKFVTVLRSSLNMFQQKTGTPASRLPILKADCLFVMVEEKRCHVVMVEQIAGTMGDRFIYVDVRKEQGELRDVVGLLSMHVGDIIFSDTFNGSPLTDNLNGEIVRAVRKCVSMSALPAEIIGTSGEHLKRDFPGKQIAFIIMRFDKTDSHNRVYEILKETLGKYDIVARKADDKEYHDDLFANVQEYLHGCDFGIAVFDQLIVKDFNPNVSLEVGYLYGLRKRVLLLKDGRIQALQSDLTGRLYKPFDIHSADSVPAVLEKWLLDRGIIDSIKEAKK